MSYDELRQHYRPAAAQWLFVAESPPPAAEAPSSRHFYRAEYRGPEDRLFVNTIKALFAEAEEQTEAQIDAQKEQWLRRYQENDCYMIEALEKSQRHQVTKEQRQERIREELPSLIERIGELARPDTKVILIKSNVYEVAAEPLRQAGFNVLNTGLVDYPGRFNQRAYREKVRALMTAAGWQY